MTGLEELLRTAADGPVSFDVDDVRRRVDQRRRRRKLQGTAMVALVLVGVTTLVFALRDQPSERVETAAVPAAAEDLVGRWQVTAEPEPAGPIDPDERVVDAQRAAHATPGAAPAEVGSAGREGRSR